jgi:hypothetical protein
VIVGWDWNLEEIKKEGKKARIVMKERKGKGD